jgi:hypothetical protein
MNKSEYSDFSSLDFVDEAIRINNQLPNVWIANFGNYSTQLGKAFEIFGRFEDLRRDLLSVKFESFPM